MTSSTFIVLEGIQKPEETSDRAGSPQGIKRSPRLNSLQKTAPYQEEGMMVARRKSSGNINIKLVTVTPLNSPINSPKNEPEKNNEPAVDKRSTL